MRRGARAARGAEPREAEGAEAVATLARVLGLLTRRPGPPLPSRPPRADAPSPFGAARLPPDLGAGEWGPRAAPEECGRAVRVPFRSSPPRAGRCLFLETLSLRGPGSPGSRSNSRPPPSVLPPGPAAPGRLPRGHARPPLDAWYSQLASGRSAGRGPGVGGGPVPARKLESFVLRPAPTGEGRRGGSGGCAGEASGGLGPGSGLDWGPGFLPAFQSVQLFEVPLGAQN